MTGDEIYRRYVVARGDPVHDLLLDLLGPHGTADSIELERMRAAGLCFNVELGLDAKRPPVGGHSVSAPGAATPERSHDVTSAGAMVAQGSGVLHTNKETPT